MAIINLPSTTVYSNLYTLSEFDAGTSLILTNDSSLPCYVIQQPTQPSVSDRSFPVRSGETTLIHANDDPIWIRGGIGQIIVQRLTGTVAPFSTVDLPHDLYTSTKEGFRRLRVDIAQTSFFEGREFRTFKEWTAATTATYVIKAVVPLDIILFSLTSAVEAGTIRVETVVGGTEGGTFSETLPILPANTMSTRPSPFYTNQTVLTAGGTLTGGTVIDVLRIKAADNSNFAGSVGVAATDERGVGAATYYFRITLTGVIGTFKARWEERP
jgi:hypothetical protein